MSASITMHLQKRSVAPRRPMKCSNRIGIDNLAIGLLYFAQDRLDSALTSRCDFFDDVVVMEGTAHGNAMAALRHI